MKVLITGGRDYADRERVYLGLDRIHRVKPITLLIDGACHMGGADLLGHEWAISRGVPTQRVRVDNALDGPWPAAGNRRNIRMYETWQPDLVLRCPGGNGTRHMASHAESQGTKVVLLTRLA